MAANPTYVLTASVQAFTTVALVGYPAAAVVVKPGVAPNFGVWAVITLAVGAALTLYSASLKSKDLLSVNWLTIPAVCLALLGVAWLINPKSVGQNAGMVVFFSVYTFGLPFWLPLAALVVHLVACNAQAVPPDHSTATFAGSSQYLARSPDGPLSIETRKKYGVIAWALFGVGAPMLAISALLAPGTLAVGLACGAAFVLALGGVFRVAVWRNIHIWRE